MVIDINEFDENWQKVAGQSFTMQKSFFNPHDFAVTKNYYVFFQNSMSFHMVSRCMQVAARVTEPYLVKILHASNSPRAL